MSDHESGGIEYLGDLHISPEPLPTQGFDYAASLNFQQAI